MAVVWDQCLMKSHHLHPLNSSHYRTVSTSQLPLLLHLHFPANLTKLHLEQQVHLSLASQQVVPMGFLRLLMYPPLAVQHRHHLSHLVSQWFIFYCEYEMIVLVLQLVGLFTIQYNNIICRVVFTVYATFRDAGKMTKLVGIYSQF